VQLRFNDDNNSKGDPLAVMSYNWGHRHTWYVAPLAIHVYFDRHYSSRTTGTIDRGMIQKYFSWQRERTSMAVESTFGSLSGYSRGNSEFDTIFIISLLCIGDVL
jgi:hypothetical protein